MWGWWCRCAGASLTNFDAAMRVVDANRARTVPYRSGCTTTIIFVVDLDFAEATFDFAVIGVGVELESGLVRNVDLHLRVSVIDIDISNR